MEGLRLCVKRAFTQCSRTRLWEVGNGCYVHPVRGVASILRETPKGGMGAHDFAARPLTSRFAADVGSLLLAVSLPQVFSFVCSTNEAPPLPLPFMDFARIVLGLVEAKHGAAHVYNLRIFPAMTTNKHNSPLPPLPIPRSLVFMCHTRTRVSTRHVCRFYQMCCSPSASLVQVLHCSSIALVCHHTAFLLSS